MGSALGAARTGEKIMAKVTAKQEMLIVDFVKVAKSNGASRIDAALPAKHPLMVSGKGFDMHCIRVVKDVLAIYKDELGNRVALMADTNTVKQFT
jgi:formate dehydrogenase maturation protein FdhE